MNDYSTIAETQNFIVLDRYQRGDAINEDYQSEDALEREFIGDLEAQGIAMPLKSAHPRQC